MFFFCAAGVIIYDNNGTEEGVGAAADRMGKRMHAYDDDVPLSSLSLLLSRDLFLCVRERERSKTKRRGRKSHFSLFHECVPPSFAPGRIGEDEREYRGVFHRSDEHHGF